MNKNAVFIAFVMLVLPALALAATAQPQDKTPGRAAGDLGNIKSDAQGNARVELTVRNLTIAGLKNPVVGRALIVHAQPDTGEQPAGGAGPRLAQGVIGIADVEQVETAARNRPR
jgi:Cu/Zn superoxide dismutase